MKLWLALLGITGIFTLAAYLIFSNMQNKITELTSANVSLQESISRIVEINKQNVDTIDILTEQFQDVRNNFAFLQNEFALIEMQNRELQARFERNDLKKLAIGKPELVENIVNNASDKAIRCFELLSGAQFTEQELNATSEKEFNSECPWLFER